MKNLLYLLLLTPLLVFTQSGHQIDSINTVLITAQKSNNWEQLMAAYQAKGKLYYSDEDHVNALPEFLKVDSISKRHQFINENTIMAIVYRARISKNTYTRDGTETANNLLEEALLKAKTFNRDKYINKIYLDFADVKGLRGEYAEAKKYTDLAFIYYKQKNNLPNISWLYRVYINYYYAVDSLEKAKQVHLKRINFFKSKNDSLEIAKALSDFGNYYRRKDNNCIKALPQLEAAKNIYESIGDATTRNYLYLIINLAHCNAEINNYKKAYNYYHQGYNLRKTIVREANNNVTRNLEAKYKGEINKNEIALLKSQNELAEHQKINQRNVLLGGLLLTSLAVLFLFVMFRNRQKTNIKLKELDKAKSSFFANISHEFRTPLTLISGPINQQLKSDKLTVDERHNLEIANRNSNRLLSLVNQLLDISKIESGGVKLQVSKGEILAFVGTLADGFSFSAKQQNITFTITTNKYEGETWYDKDAVEKIVINLLSNAFKYTPKNGAISCETRIDNDIFYFNINNSATISKEEIKNIFQRFHQGNQNKEGIGLGLALVKELVELHKGQITVASVNNNTAFLVVLPVNKKAFNESELSVNKVNSENDNTLYNNETQLITNENQDEINDQELPILLIVEDNDEVKFYLQSIFKNQYKILTAPNGEQGINTAIEFVPDIIISDIMMPVKDGIALCNTLKTDERTSHIPIILLTAKVGEEHEIKGIKTGADDYITKPFNEDVLQLKVKKLVEGRALLRDRYSQELILKPKDISVNSFDEQFLERVQTIFKDRLIESSFSIDEFSKSVGMSRMQLHRKLKALTGFTTSEFIRSQRLKLAAQLLKKSEINISQVGYSVGFNDHAYFSKCFKEIYNCTPTEYANSTK